MNSQPDGRTVLAVVVTLLAWASAFVAIRGVGADFSPGALALGRLLVGTAVLGLLLAGRSWIRPTGREWALLVVCGFTVEPYAPGPTVSGGFRTRRP